MKGPWLERDARETAPAPEKTRVDTSRFSATITPFTAEREQTIMAEQDEGWPSLEGWLEAGNDLQDLPMRPDGKRLRELTNAEARERVLAYLDESARRTATKRLSEERRRRGVAPTAGWLEPASGRPHSRTRRP